MLQAEREFIEQMIEEKSTRAILKNTMDPLLSSLSKDFISSTDLTNKLYNVFKVVVIPPYSLNIIIGFLSLLTNSIWG